MFISGALENRLEAAGVACVFLITLSWLMTFVDQLKKRPETNECQAGAHRKTYFEGLLITRWKGSR
jgi:hypothetical protein